ncbi:hypothetical protein [Brevibacillus reuszeri]|uniref:hypothetical protein n=1 Tax=Brevibacillus reuszeri TaxID=54915 RepID=UPI003D2491AF
MITTAQCADGLGAFISDAFTPYFADIYAKRRMEDGEVLSMSMAGVYIQPGMYENAEAIAKQAAVMKKLAKSYAGTVFIKDCEFPFEDRLRLQG